MANPVLYVVEDGIAVIRINRPEAANAVNGEVMRGLADCLQQAAGSPDVRALLLTGTGTRVFAAGGDLKEFHHELQTEEHVYEKFSLMRDNLYRLATFPKPVIAVINGTARGGGAELATACHFRIASDTANIGFVQVNLGISTGWGGAAVLERTVGYPKALRLILTGELLSASKAKEISLFDEVVSADTLWETAWTFAKQLAGNSPEAVQGVLQTMNRSRALPLHEAMELETRLCSSLWTTDAHRESVEAFLNPRKN